MVSPTIPAVSKGPLTSRQKLVLQPLDQQPAPGTLNYYPAITTISTEPQGDGKSDRVFVETFLIDAVSAPNKKGWRVSYDNPTDFDRRVQDSKNHPLVLFQTKHPTKDGELIFDHPVAPITSLEAAADPLRATIEFQKKYTIGYARHFKKVKDGVWHAVYEIVNPKAKKFFTKAKNEGVKLFTSPHIVRPASEPDRTNIKEWAIIHNAIVSNPANNEAIASVKDIKAVKPRDPVDFSSLFASMDTEDTDDFDLDADYLLEIYTNNNLTSHDNISDNLNHMPETASINAAPSSQMETTVTNPSVSTVTTQVPGEAKEQVTTIPASQIQTQQQNPSKTQENKPPQQAKTLEQTLEQTQPNSELAQLKAQLEQVTKANQELQTKYAQTERKGNIEKLFAPIVSQLYADPKTGVLDEKSYNAEVSRLVKSNHSQEEIQELIEARYIKAQWNAQQRNGTKNEKASLTSQVNETASFPYTKMQTTTAGSQQKVVDSIGLSVLRRLQGELL